MKYRKLRIAWSVAWGLAAALLIVLWVRSYWWAEEIDIRQSLRISSAGCANGELFLAINPVPVTIRGGWSFRHDPASRAEPPPGESIPAFYFSIQGGFTLVVPFWFTALSAAVCATLSQARWSKRFSLRTLLIATTVVAIGLGLVIYAVRN
jgi:hypothetical protein